MIFLEQAVEARVEKLETNSQASQRI